MQEEKNKNIEKDYFSQFVKSKLENHQLSPDDDCWKGIEQGLKSKKKVLPVWTWISGAAAVAVIALLFVLQPFSEKMVFEQMKEETAHLQEEGKPSLTPEPKANVIGDVEKEKITFQKTKKLAMNREANIMAENKVESAESIAGNKVGDTQSEEPMEALTAEIEEKAGEPYRNEKQEPISLPSLPDDLWASDDEPVRIKKKDKKWLLAASLGSSTSVSTNGSTYYYDSNNELNTSGPGLPNFGNSDPGLSIGDIGEDFSDADHKPPLSFGLTVRKDINQYLAVETGLTYTYLLSKYERKGAFGSEATLKQHYLGVPVNLVAYVLNDQSKWNLYFSGGAMIEKGLRLDYSQHTYRNGGRITTKIKEDISGVQWSINGSFGASYAIYRDLSIYFEPKVTYYMKNNQPLSARTKNPLNLGFTTGLRFKL